MNYGYPIAGLGVLGLVLGAAMYAASWHRTVALGGVGVGVVLVLAGVYLARRTMTTKTVPQTQPQP